jgi:hypothetical protein
MLDIVQPKNEDVDEDATYDEVLPHEKYAQNQPIIPVSCESNEPIVEWTDKKHYSLVLFQINFFLVKVLLTDCQLNKIGNMFLSIMMVDWIILYSLLMVSINCSMHVAFVTWLESPAKPSYCEKSWCFGQFRGISKTTNLGRRSSSLP